MGGCWLWAGTPDANYGSALLPASLFTFSLSAGVHPNVWVGAIRERWRDARVEKTPPSGRSGSGLFCGIFPAIFPILSPPI